MMSNNDHYPQVPGPLISTDPIFKELEILKVEDVFKLHLSKFIFSCLSLNTPSIFFDWFILNHTVHGYNTVSNTTIKMINYIEMDNVLETNTLQRFKTCKLWIKNV